MKLGDRPRELTHPPFHPALTFDTPRLSRLPSFAESQTSLDFLPSIFLLTELNLVLDSGIPGTVPTEVLPTEVPCRSTSRISSEP